MRPRHLVSFALLALSLTAVPFVIQAFSSTPSARALPPAGTDSLGVSAEVSVVSRLGSETISLYGIAGLQRSDPVLDGGVERVDIEIASLHLEGNSLTGPVTIDQSASSVSTPSIGTV